MPRSRREHRHSHRNGERDVWPLTTEFNISSGIGLSRGKAAVVAVLPGMGADPDSPNSAIYVLDHGSLTRWARFAENIVCLAPGDESAIFGLEEDGKVYRITSGGPEVDWELEARGPMRRLIEVEGNLIAVGFGGQAFKRSTGGIWRDISVPRSSAKSYSDAHFEHVTAVSPDEIYAAAMDGVIWWYDGAKWTPVDCGTNLNFYAIARGTGDKIFAAGQHGIFVQGRRDAFEPIEHDAQMDFWGVEEFHGKVYLAGFTAMGRWDGEVVEPAGAAMELAEHFYDLNAVDGVLWSFGMTDVVRSDGETWERVDAEEVV